jgi:hypothetical protein
MMVSTCVLYPFITTFLWLKGWRKECQVEGCFNRAVNKYYESRYTENSLHATILLTEA